MAYWHDGWTWMAFMPLVWIALVGMVVWALLRVTQRPAGRDQDWRQPERETAEEILDRRFASGEIDTETYRRAREQLASHRPSS